MKKIPKEFIEVVRDEILLNKFNSKIFMSQTFIAVFVGILAEVLPKLGVTIGTETLTSTVSTIAVIVTGIWVLIRRHRAGGVNVVGIRN